MCGASKRQQRGLLIGLTASACLRYPRGVLLIAMLSCPYRSHLFLLLKFQLACVKHKLKSFEAPLIHQNASKNPGILALFRAVLTSSIKENILQHS